MDVEIKKDGGLTWGDIISLGTQGDDVTDMSKGDPVMFVAHMSNGDRITFKVTSAKTEEPTPDSGDYAAKGILWLRGVEH